ncbi:MAG: tetratricopeptide repeat protein [Betaproteobacteria bacterium]
MALVVARGVSLINKVLQDLDRRQALGAGADAGVLRPAPANPQHREWFWRIVTVLLIAGVGWVAWTAYQLLPRPLVTDLAFLAAEEARARPKPVGVSAPVPVKPEAPAKIEEPPPPPAPAQPARAATTPAAEPLKLAQEIETPVRERAAAPARRAPEAVPKPVAIAQARKPAVDKRELVPSAADKAETHFRRAALLLNQGRVAEAEERLVAALKADPSHAAARQAYVALLLEQQRIDAARRQLQAALEIDAAQPTFALALARIHAAQRDYRAALAALDRAGANGQHPEFQAMRGAVLQRLGRDAEAIEAFHVAVRGGPQPGTTWVNLGISLEAVGRKAEAAAAYRKAVANGPLAAEAREYAQARARALE